MKKLAILLSAVTFALFPPYAQALDLYGFGSYWEIEDSDGTWGVGAGASLQLFNKYFRLDGRVYFFENSDLDDDDELELLPIDFGLQIHLLPSEVIDPYILGGASYVYADSDRIDVDSEVGAYVGGGFELELTSYLKPFGELVYRSVELESNFGSSNRDIDVSGITVIAGLKIHF